MWFRRLFLCSALIALCPAPAAARDITGAVYDDLKSVISGLIEAEVAKSLVPELSCTLDVTVQLYFKATLQRLYDRRYAGLGDVIANDLATLVRSLVFAALNGDTDLTGALRGQVQWAPGDCTQRIKDAQGPARAALTWYTVAGKTPTADQIAHPYARHCADTPSTARVWLACELSAGVAEATVGNSAAARHHLYRALAVFEHWARPTVDAIASTAAELRAYAAGMAGAAGAVAGEVRSLAQALRDRPDDRLGGAVSMLQLIDDIRRAACRRPEVLSEPLCTSTAYADVAALLTNVARGELSAIADWLFTHLHVPSPAASAEIRHDEVEEQVGKDVGVKQSVFGTLIITTTDYALESRRQGIASQATRAAFVDAAQKALLAIGEDQGGFDRSFGMNLVVPQLAWRASLSLAYATGPDAGPIRFPVGVDWLILRKRWRYSRRLYLATNIVLLDPLAPLAELSDRDPALEYADESKLWANVASPRLEFLFGAPHLTRHLALSASVGWRFVVPGEPDDAGQVTYGSADDWTRAITASLAVKYLL